MRKKTYEDHYRDGEVAIKIAARALAKRAVEDGLRAKGVRVTLVRPAEITEKAKVLLTNNPELWRAAYHRAERAGWIDPSVRGVLAERWRAVVP
jgi:hypothetical protein